MSENTLQFELVTPEKIAVSAQVEMVEVPGELGDFGVLPGHAPFMSIIRPGVVSVHESADSTNYYFIPAGYAEVNPEGCTVLAEHVRDMANVSSEQAEKELKIAQFDLSEAKTEEEKEAAICAVAIAEALKDAIVSL